MGEKFYTGRYIQPIKRQKSLDGGQTWEDTGDKTVEISYNEYQCPIKPNPVTYSSIWSQWNGSNFIDAEGKLEISFVDGNKQVLISELKNFVNDGIMFELDSLLGGQVIIKIKNEVYNQISLQGVSNENVEFYQEQSEDKEWQILSWIIMKDSINNFTVYFTDKT